ncbi:hypothetical protein Syun_006308 [Stephania yunnanensis]|uniref:DUF7903 domain-containing protein n=1 Tax=Stephania yunnanensis TaxID=152371 RepID=A0AAP0PXF3_9MAGN
MAYIPPHKRHSTDSDAPKPSPSEPPLPLHSQRNSRKRGGQIVYAQQSVSRWFIASSIHEDVVSDDDRIPCPIRLEPISCESVERRRGGEKPMVLVCDRLKTGETENCGNLGKSPWKLIVEKIESDLLDSFQNVRDEMFSNELKEEVKPSFIARFGKIFFHRNSVSLDTLEKISDVERSLHQVKRSFYTNISDSFMEAIHGEAIPEFRVDFSEDKEYYHVKVFDKRRPTATISCKCSVMEGGAELELCKIELNEVRHLVVDISCLNKNLDLRLMLRSKRILTALDDEEKHSLLTLMKSAIIDPHVKGGLRWPLGKESLGDRYSIVGVWHTKSQSFKSSSTRLELRLANRFDYRTSSGEATKEVILRMRGVKKQLREEILEVDVITEMLLENLKLIWNNFLCQECSFN